MKKILMIASAIAFFIFSCVKNSPTSPEAPVNTPDFTAAESMTATLTNTMPMTATISPTESITDTITQTYTITHTATVTVTPEDTQTASVTPTVTNSPSVNDFGSVTASRADFIAGESGITVTFVYTCARPWSAEYGFGVLEIGVPDGFSAFSSNPLDKGYAEVSTSGVPVLDISYCCNPNYGIYIKVPYLNTGDTITLVYGSKAGGGPGADACATAYNGCFGVRADMSGYGYTYDLALMPACRVNYATATVTETMVCTQTNTNTPSPTATFSPTATRTYTATQTGTFTITRTFTATGTQTGTPTATPTYTATPLNIYWGGSGADYFNSVCTDNAGNIYAAGSTASFGAGSSDMVLVKYSPDGVFQWQQTYGGASAETANCVRAAASGGFIIAGHTGSYGAGGYDFYLVKTDADGNLVWEKTFGDANNNSAYSVTGTADGGYILAGDDDIGPNGGADIQIVKTDASGNFEWEVYLGDTGADLCRAIFQTADGNYVAAGAMSMVSYAGIKDLFIHKFRASDRAQMWSRTYGTASYYENGLGGSLLDTGDFIIAGNTNYGASDAYVVNIASDGTYIDGYSHGWSSEPEMLYSAVKTTDGYVTVGYAEDAGRSDYDVYVVKYDFSLSSGWVWEKYIGGAYSDSGKCIIAVTGGFVIAGDTSSYGTGGMNGYITKIDFNGNRIW